LLWVFLGHINSVFKVVTLSQFNNVIMWSMWLTNFTQILDSHAPFKKKRIGIESPWITPDVVKKNESYIGII
jgi:hypothetical protein